jgi:hypothetical protein
LTDEASGFKAKTSSFERTTKPDIALGLRFLVKPKNVPNSGTEPFSACWDKNGRVHGPELESLEQHPDARLHARPSKNALTYPCLIHEVKSGQVGLNIAANQLSLLLAYALDQQEELRRVAGAPVEERMPIFGVASSGAFVSIWYGAYVGDEIVSRKANLILQTIPAHKMSLLSAAIGTIGEHFFRDEAKPSSCLHALFERMAWVAAEDVRVPHRQMA